MAQLSEALRLPCGAVLPNRLAKAALTEGLADPHNRATARHVALYRRWSEGGAGLLMTGNVQTDRMHLERPGNIAIDGNGGIEQLRAFARAGTSAGNHLWMQISHAGRQTPAHVNPAPLAPSAVALNLPGGFGQPRAMTETNILDVIARFGRVAQTAREAGFTGVQIHGAHGYLISQFLNPLVNHRTDDWGGSLANRARFLLEIVRRVRAAVGADFPVAVKLNSADFQQGGFTNEEAEQVVRWLASERIDLLEISGGNYEQPRMMGGLADVTAVRESTWRREAYFLDFAARLRPGLSVPLMVTGGFRSRAAMEDALAAGAVDVIGLGRPMCVAPDLPNQLLTGQVVSGPTYERSLRLDRSKLSPDLDEATTQQIEAWGTQGWFCLQLLRMGNGGDPDTGMSVFDAFHAYQDNEAATAAALVR